MPDLKVILIWVALGFVAGVIAKFIMPGRQGGRFLTTTILGILGAFLGGFLADKTGLATITPGIFSVPSVISAVVGALIILIIFNLVFGRR
jgi:uncharacterized membrane protein YeaQ/YmgE (transglycosylase-associated protein family)